ncbi:putative actin-like [Capsicum annuum]|nr:putative actin-like [Capsicum annuum]
MKLQEYSIIDQLKKTPVQISLLYLLLHSKEHRDIILKVLNEAYVPREITVNQLEKMVGKSFKVNQISFSDDELPVEGANICLISTLQKLNIGAERIRPNNVFVRAFDGAKSNSIGEIELMLIIGPVEFAIEFQMIKSEHDRKKVVIHGEGDLSACEDSPLSLIEANNVEETFFYQIFDTVPVNHILEGKVILGPQLSSTSIMVNMGTFRLGFEPTIEDLKKARGRKKKIWSLPRPMPLLRELFVMSGITKHVEFEVELVDNFQNLLIEVDMVKEGEGLSTELVAHKFSTDPAFPPVKQNLRKFKTNADHVKDLRKFFERLRRHNLKLNPAKCVFGVPFGKLLGFVVSRRGIELDPSKIKAIQDLPPPKNMTEEAFDRIKRYLSNQPVLVPPDPGRPLILYLSVMDNFFGCVLGQHAVTGKKEQYEPLKAYFPDEEVLCVDEVIIDVDPSWKLFFDGAVNMKRVGIGIVLISEVGQHFSSRDQHAYYNLIEEEINGEPWFFDIKRHIQSGKYPTHATSDQKRTIRCLDSGFFLSGGILYKRTPNLGLLRCVDVREASTIMVEVHSRVCGPHMNGYVLSKKTLREGYYWLTMEQNSIHFVWKCHQCQVEAKGKFSPNWQGPFIVKKVLPNGALYLTDIEGKMAEMAINADAVKRYYDPPENWDFTFVQDPPENGILPFVQVMKLKVRNPPEEQGDGNGKSGARLKNGVMKLKVKAMDRNLDGTSLDSPTRWFGSDFGWFGLVFGSFRWTPSVRVAGYVLSTLSRFADLVFESDFKFGFPFVSSWFVIKYYVISSSAMNQFNISTDQLSLLSLKSQIISDPFHCLDESWSPGTSICHWVGVTCGSRHLRRRFLNPSNMDLTGVIPSELGNLTFLVSLDLGSNNFHGNLPQEMAHLHRLKFLDLSFNSFSAEVPSWFGFLHQLQVLKLGNNSFTGSIPSSFSNMSTLETLNLKFNSIEGQTPKVIGSLINLSIKDGGEQAHRLYSYVNLECLKVGEVRIIF